MKKNCIALSALLFVNSMFGMDGVEFLKNHPWFDSVSVSPTHLMISMSSKGSKPINWSEEEYKRRYTVERVLTPDAESSVGWGDIRIAFKPVSFKNQYKGFRVTWMPMGIAAEQALFSHRPPSEIVYLALSDTPMTMGEDDVAMVMDNGEWVKAEDSRSLELEKLGAMAEQLIRNQEWIIQNYEKAFGQQEMADLWNTLVARGFIKSEVELPPAVTLEKEKWLKLLREEDEKILATAAAFIKQNESMETASSPSHEEVKTSTTDDTVVKDKPSEAQPEPNRLWLYAGILFVLCALFFCLRRKFKTGNYKP